MQIYLAVDQDAAGENLARELSRRLGRQRCKLTEWPADWHGHVDLIGIEEAERRAQQHAAVRPRAPFLSRPSYLRVA